MNKNKERKIKKKNKKQNDEKENESKQEFKDHVNELEFIQNRIKLFDEIYNEQIKENSLKESKKIQITLPDGSIQEGESFKTTPLDIANKLSKSLAKNAIVAKMNDKLYDLTRPLEEDCQLKILTFDDPEGKHVFLAFIITCIRTKFGKIICRKINSRSSIRSFTNVT